MDKFFKRLFFIFRLHKSIPFAFNFFRSKEVHWKKKLFFAVIVTAYTLFPMDVLHDYLPLLGVVDDVALAAVALEFMKRNSPLPLREKYKD